MSSLATIRTNLAGTFNGLATTTGTLTGYARVPQSYTFPCAVVGQITKGPVETFNGNRRWKVGVDIYAAAADPLAGQPEMDPLLSDRLSGSVEDAIEANPTLSGACDDLTVLGFTEPGGWQDLQNVSVLHYRVELEILT